MEGGGSYQKRRNGRKMPVHSTQDTGRDASPPLPREGRARAAIRDPRFAIRWLSGAPSLYIIGPFDLQGRDLMSQAPKGGGGDAKITPRATDYSRWYQDIVQQAELADHSAVRG